MHRYFSRLVAVLFVAVTAMGFAGRASAQALPHFARGSAQFVSPTDFVGTGHATHLGRYNEVGSLAFAPTGDPAVLSFTGWSIYTAANGDDLRATLAGRLNTSTGAIIATVTYVGGTGRFADACGASCLAGRLDGGTARVAVAGFIDY